MSTPKPPTSLQKPAPARRHRSGGVRAAGRWLRNVLAVVGLGLVVYHLCFEVSVVISGSMAPTLQGDGGPGSDWVLLERVSYRLRAPRRWEVAQYETEDHMVVAKRIVGLPGETIGLADGKPTIDGAPAGPPPRLGFLHYEAEARLSPGRSAACGDGYFLLGDDSRDSYDSRYEGPLPRPAIRARAWLILWPPSRMGIVR